MLSHQLWNGVMADIAENAPTERERQLAELVSACADFALVEHPNTLGVWFDQRASQLLEMQ